MKPPIPTPEPVPVQTLRRYGLNATADEVAEVYRQNADLLKLAQRVSSAFSDAQHSGSIESGLRDEANTILTTATQKKG